MKERRVAVFTLTFKAFYVGEETPIVQLIHLLKQNGFARELMMQTYEDCFTGYANSFRYKSDIRITVPS